MCYMCVWYSIPNIETISQICSLTVAKVWKLLHLDWNNNCWSYLMWYIKCSNDDLTSMWDFGTYHILAEASINRPCWRTGASCLNSGLHLYIVYTGSKCSGESTHLHRLTWPFISWNCDKYMYQNQMSWLIWFILCVTSYTRVSQK